MLKFFNKLRLPHGINSQLLKRLSSVTSSQFDANKEQRVYFETYGCQMNFNDTNIAQSILEDAGFSRAKSLDDATVVLLMTCAIREGAEQKIWKRLEGYKRLSRRKKPVTIGVLGCMAERLKSKLLESANNVGVVCGPDAYRDLPRLLEEARAGNRGMNVALSLEETYADVPPVRLCAGGSPSAFVSIMRGCDNMCTYCIVPFTRGRERSRPLHSIVDETKRLVEMGVKEIVLLGQNVNSYRDLSSESQVVTPQVTISRTPDHRAEGFTTVYKPKQGGTRFFDLLEIVSRIDPNLRIRFTSPHPKDFPDEVFHLIAERPNIAKQLHLPAQSGNDRVLENMGRGYTRESYLNLVAKARSIIKNVGLTSDFISGFCGETESEHQDTLTLMQEVAYNFVFCFPYSMREKTRAFHRLVDDVPEDVKSRRHLELIDEFRRGALAVNEAQLGEVQLVLVEGFSKRSKADLFGRNEANTKVIFPSSSLPFSNDAYSNPRYPESGDYVAVKIETASSQVLKGTPLFRTNIQEFYS